MGGAAGEFLRARAALISVRRVPGGAPLALALFKALEENDLGTLVALSGAAEQLLEVKSFEERLHPRDRHGRWAHKPSAGGALRSVDKPAAAPAILPSAWPEQGLEWDARWAALSNDTPVWVFHSTEKATAEHMLSHGADPATKPTNLNRRRYEAGNLQDVFYQPGAGLGAGLAVALHPGQAGGYGHQLLAVRVRKGDISVSPEQADLGATDPGETLRVGDAIVNTVIAPQDIVPVGEAGRDPSAVDVAGQLRERGLLVKEHTLNGAPVPAVLTSYTREPTLMTPAQQAERFGFHISSGGDAVPGGYNGYLTAKDPKTGETMGTLEYQSASAPYYEADVAMVRTEPKYQGHGVATNLLQAARAELGEYTWSLGMLTDEGATWEAGLPDQLRHGTIAPLRETKSAIAVPFNPALHPRDWHGQFARKPGGGHRPMQWLRQQMGENWLGRHMTSSGLRRRGFDATPLALLVTTSHRDMADYAASPLGRLLVPQNWSRADESQHDGVVVAADNGGFWGVDEPAYKHMCERLKTQGVTPVWVTVPDVLHHLEDGTVVGDAKATQQRFEQWKQYLDHLGFPAAFVAQDGADSPENLAWLEQHWDDIDALFIGGSDAFKLGPGAAKVTQLAHEHGKIVHIGRVNSHMRLSYCRDVLHADSCDGKQWAEFKKVTLAKGLDFIPSGEAPKTKVGQRWVQEALRASETGSPWPRPPWMGHSWIGYFGEPLPADAPEKAKRFYEHFSDAGDFIKALEPGSTASIVYFEPLSDALYMVGLSDYWHLEMTAGEPGFTIAHENDRQLQAFTELLDLPPAQTSDGRASWPDVLVVPGVEGEDEEKAFDPEQPRWPRGTPRAGQWRPKLGTQEPNRAADFRIGMGSVQAAFDRLMGATTSDRTDPEQLADLGRRIDSVATTFSTVRPYQVRRNAISDEIDAAEKQLDQLDEERRQYFEPRRVPAEHAHRGRAWAREERARRDALLKKIDGVEEKIVVLQEERYRLSSRVARARRDAIVGVLEHLRPMGGKLKATPVFVNDAPPASPEVIQMALQKADDNVAEIQRLLPKDWIDDMNGAGETWIRLHSKRIRGFQRFDGTDKAGEVTHQPMEAASGGDSEIALNLQHTARTYLHEFGHRVQAVGAADVSAVSGSPSPRAARRASASSVRHEAERRYLRSRTADQGARPLTALCPGQGYEIYEVAIPDEFPHPYYGKMYGESYDNPYNELLTMSLENLFYGDLQFEDGGTANWLLGMLAAT